MVNQNGKDLSYQVNSNDDKPRYVFLVIDKLDEEKELLKDVFTQVEDAEGNVIETAILVESKPTSVTTFDRIGYGEFYWLSTKPGSQALVRYLLNLMQNGDTLGEVVQLVCKETDEKTGVYSGIVSETKFSDCLVQTVAESKGMNGGDLSDNPSDALEDQMVSQLTLQFKAMHTDLYEYDAKGDLKGPREVNYSNAQR